LEFLHSCVAGVNSIKSCIAFAVHGVAFGRATHQGVYGYFMRVPVLIAFANRYTARQTRLIALALEFAGLLLPVHRASPSG